MTPYYQDDQVTLYHGDCIAVMAQLGEASVDAVVTDPPYGLEFMGKDWDSPWKAEGAHWREASRLPGSHSTNPTPRPPNFGTAGKPFQDWCLAWAQECFRVLKPGGHMLAFGGTRTWHRLACAVEDAGFEIRDSIAWLYGSGFPKSLDVSKAIDKAAGAERTEKVGERGLARWKTGAPGGAAMKDDGGIRQDFDKVNTLLAPVTDAAKQWEGWGTALKPAFEPIVVARKPLRGTVAANVVEHGTGALNIDACRIDLQGESWGGNRENAHSDYSGKVFGKFGEQYAKPSNPAGRWPTNVVLGGAAAEELDKQSGNSISRIGKPRGAASGDGWGMTATGAEYADAGGAGASRFFPVFRYEAKAGNSERPAVDGIAHPTVKPLDLMRWLVRLVTPPGGLVLDPFVGSGTTAEACIHEYKRCIAVEREPDYLPLIEARLSKPMEIGFNFGEGA